MIRSKLFLVSENAAIDARQNTICVFHILEQITAPVFPTVLLRVAIAAIFEREDADPSEVEIGLEIHSGPHILMSRTLPLNFQHRQYARSIIDMQGIVVPAPVPLIFSVNLDGAPVGTWTVTVIQVGNAPVQMNIPVPEPPNPQ